MYHNFDIKVIPATDKDPQMYEYTQEQYTLEEHRSMVEQGLAARLVAAEEAILALMDGGIA